MHILWRNVSDENTEVFITRLISYNFMHLESDVVTFIVWKEAGGDIQIRVGV
jgi:hypothetical protein